MLSGANLSLRDPDGTICFSQRTVQKLFEDYGASWRILLVKAHWHHDRVCPCLWKVAFSSGVGGPAREKLSASSSSQRCHYARTGACADGAEGHQSKYVHQTRLLGSVSKLEQFASHRHPLVVPPPFTFRQSAPSQLLKTFAILSKKILQQHSQFLCASKSTAVVVFTNEL